MDEQTFKRRTKEFGLAVIRLVERLPRTRTGNVIGRQLLRSATSVGANYRAACRGRSTSDVLAKLAIVEEEADESIYWLELLVESQIVAKVDADKLGREADELLAMTVASIKTLRKRLAVKEPQESKSKNGGADKPGETRPIQSPNQKRRMETSVAPAQPVATLDVNPKSKI